MIFHSITHCSALKATPSDAVLNGPVMPQKQLAKNWCSKVLKAQKSLNAANLYTGRGYRLLVGKIPKEQRLFIVSAGLGLVDCETVIPSYDCTIAAGSETSLSKYVEGKICLSDWWNSISKSGFSDGKIADIQPDADFILISLTSNYLDLVAEDLRNTNTVKIIFVGPKVKLPDLGADVIRAPYTDAFDGPDSPMPGVKSDFAQRCHADFISRLKKYGDVTFALQSVSHDMKIWNAPKRLNNKSFDDAEILRLIHEHKDKFTAIGKLHRFFRHELNVACEQKRFTKLYRQVIGQ